MQQYLQIHLHKTFFAAETIQGRKLFLEIRYKSLDQLASVLLKMPFFSRESVVQRMHAGLATNSSQVQILSDTLTFDKFNIKLLFNQLNKFRDILENPSSHVLHLI